MKLKALIIDDEPKLRTVLEIKLKDKCPNVEVLGVAGNIQEAYELIRQTNPDLIFLDIAMPGGSGFNLLKKFETIFFDTIFVTGYNEYAIDALRVSAVDYLLKPIRSEDLIEAVKKATNRKKEKVLLNRYELLQHNLQHARDQQSKITIPGTQTYDFVVVNDIIRCEGWQKYSRIHIKQGNVLVSSYNLGVYRQLLQSYDFYACHKSHLINTHHISRYLREGIVIMSDGSRVPVSRRKKEEFIETVIKKM